jgi:hypothetical protein
MTTSTTTSNETSEPAANNRRPLILLLAMLLIVLAIPAIPGRNHTSETFDQSAADQFDATNPNTVFLGNSLLATRIDPDYLTELTGNNTASLAIEGTAPGIWYLQLKNIVAPAENPPDQIFIFFHDDLVTRPIYFTGVEDRKLVERLTNPNNNHESLPAAPNTLGEKFRKAFTTIYPIAKSRPTNATSPINSIRTHLTGITHDESSETADEFFAFANKRDQAEKVQQPKYHGSFDSNVDNSFLPLIIELANDIDAQLTIVRVAARPKPNGTPNEPQTLATYTSDLANYLEASDVRYFDMTTRIDTGTIDAAMYYDGYHLKHRFRQSYTELFATWPPSTAFGDDQSVPK